MSKCHIQARSYKQHARHTRTHARTHTHTHTHTELRHQCTSIDTCTVWCGRSEFIIYTLQDLPGLNTYMQSVDTQSHLTTDQLVGGNSTTNNNNMKHAWELPVPAHLCIAISLHNREEYNPGLRNSTIIATCVQRCSGWCNNI